MTYRDLAKISGLHLSTLHDLSNRTTWKGVSPETIDAFTKACGINLFRLREQRYYFKLARTKMGYIRRADKMAQRMYARIQKLLIQKKADELRPHGGEVL